jgi:hypothetical protein
LGKKVVLLLFFRVLKSDLLKFSFSLILFSCIIGSTSLLPFFQNQSLELAYNEQPTPDFILQYHFSSSLSGSPIQVNYSEPWQNFIRNVLYPEINFPFQNIKRSFLSFTVDAGPVYIDPYGEYELYNASLEDGIITVPSFLQLIIIKDHDFKSIYQSVSNNLSDQSLIYLHNSGNPRYLTPNNNSILIGGINHTSLLKSDYNLKILYPQTYHNYPVESFSYLPFFLGLEETKSGFLMSETTFFTFLNQTSGINMRMIDVEYHTSFYFSSDLTVRDLALDQRGLAIFSEINLADAINKINQQQLLIPHEIFTNNYHTSTIQYVFIKLDRIQDVIDQSLSITTSIWIISLIAGISVIIIGFRRFSTATTYSRILEYAIHQGYDINYLRIKHWSLICSTIIASSIIGWIIATSLSIILQKLPLTYVELPSLVLALLIPLVIFFIWEKLNHKKIMRIFDQTRLIPLTFSKDTNIGKILWIVVLLFPFILIFYNFPIFFVDYRFFYESTVFIDIIYFTVFVGLIIPIILVIMKNINTLFNAFLKFTLKIVEFRLRRTVWDFFVLSIIRNRKVQRSVNFIPLFVLITLMTGTFLIEIQSSEIEFEENLKYGADITISDSFFSYDEMNEKLTIIRNLLNSTDATVISPYWVFNKQTAINVNSSSIEDIALMTTISYLITDFSKLEHLGAATGLKLESKEINNNQFPESILSKRLINFYLPEITVNKTVFIRFYNSPGYTEPMTLKITGDYLLPPLISSSFSRDTSMLIDFQQFVNSTYLGSLTDVQTESKGFLVWFPDSTQEKIQEYADVLLNAGYTIQIDPNLLESTENPINIRVSSIFNVYSFLIFLLFLLFVLVFLIDIQNLQHSLHPIAVSMLVQKRSDKELRWCISKTMFFYSISIIIISFFAGMALAYSIEAFQNFIYATNIRLWEIPINFLSFRVLTNVLLITAVVIIILFILIPKRLKIEMRTESSENIGYIN